MQMALIKCKECGKDVSDKAAACPHCGAPVELPAAPAQPVPDAAQGTTKKKMNIWKIIVLVFVALMVIGFFAKKEEPQNTTSNLPISIPAATPAASSVPITAAQPVAEMARVTVESGVGCRTQEALGQLITYATDNNLNGMASMVNSGLCEQLPMGQDVTILRRINEKIVQIRVRNGLGESITLWTASMFLSAL